MKKIVTLIGLLLVLCSFKGDVNVNPEFLGKWRCVIVTPEKKIMEYVIIITAHDKPNKFNVYRRSDPEGKPFWIGKMEDETHFAAKNHENVSSTITAVHKINGYWDNHKLYLTDDVEQTTYAGNSRKIGNSILKRVYLKWDDENKKYIDFPNLSKVQPTGGENQNISSYKYNNGGAPNKIVH